MDPIKKPADLKAYFATIATDLNLGFEYGNSERILNRQLSQIEYPLLWLETPDVRHSRNGGLVRNFDTAFLCLTNAPTDDPAEQDELSEAMFAKCEAVLQRLQLDADPATGEAPFVFDQEGTVFQKKEKWSGDNDWGWRVEFSLTGAACEWPDCCD